MMLYGDVALFIACCNVVFYSLLCRYLEHSALKGRNDVALVTPDVIPLVAFSSGMTILTKKNLFVCCTFVQLTCVSRCDDCCQYHIHVLVLLFLWKTGIWL